MHLNVDLKCFDHGFCFHKCAPNILKNTVFFSGKIRNLSLPSDLTALWHQSHYKRSLCYQETASGSCFSQIIKVSRSRDTLKRGWIGMGKTGVIKMAVLEIGFWIKSDCSLICTEIKYEVCVKGRQGQALSGFSEDGLLSLSTPWSIYSLSTLAWPPADTASEASPASSTAPSHQKTVSQEEMNITTAYNFSVFKPQMDSDPLWSPCDVGYGDIHFTACLCFSLPHLPADLGRILSHGSTHTTLKMPPSSLGVIRGNHKSGASSSFSVTCNSDRIELFHCVRHLHNC